MKNVTFALLASALLSIMTVVMAWGSGMTSGTGGNLYSPQLSWDEWGAAG